MGKVALPFLQMPSTTAIPLKTKPLDADATLGDHLRKRRIDLGLLQREVAKLIGVSEDSITYWENGRAKPQIQHMPKIIEFLGYNPLEVEEKNLAGKIKNYRLSHGLSHKKFGKLVEVDATTVGACENETSPPKDANLEMLKRILN
jgi:DNA-binding XRE family transcriptional regulator